MRSIRHDLYIFNGNDEKLSIIEYNDHKKEKTSRALLNSTVYLAEVELFLKVNKNRLQNHHGGTFNNSILND